MHSTWMSYILSGFPALLTTLDAYRAIGAAWTLILYLLTLVIPLLFIYAPTTLCGSSFLLRFFSCRSRPAPSLLFLFCSAYIIYIVDSAVSWRFTLSVSFA